MQYNYIDPITFFKEPVVVDEENGLIGYKGLVIGTITPSLTFVEIKIEIPVIEGSKPMEPKVTVDDILSDEFKTEFKHELFFPITPDYNIRLGYRNSSLNVYLAIPFLQYLEENEFEN